MTDPIRAVESPQLKPRTRRSGAGESLGDRSHFTVIDGRPDRQGDSMQTDPTFWRALVEHLWGVLASVLGMLAASLATLYKVGQNRMNERLDDIAEDNGKRDERIDKLEERVGGHELSLAELKLHAANAQAERAAIRTAVEKLADKIDELPDRIKS